MERYSQISDINYHETFSSTVFITFVWVLTQLRVQCRLTVHQMDVKTNYLNDPIKCELYMEQPEGLAINGKNVEKFVGRLKKTHCTLWNKNGQNYKTIVLHSYLIIQGYWITCWWNGYKQDKWGILIWWKSEKYQTVTLTTCEREVLAAAAATWRVKVLNSIRENYDEFWFVQLCHHVLWQTDFTLAKSLVRL